MAVESEDDLDMFFELDDFGTKYIYNGKTYQGLFDKEPFLLDDGTQTFTTEQISLEVKTSNICGMKIEDEVCVGKTNYKVKDIQDDSTGMTTLELYVKD